MSLSGRDGNQELVVIGVLPAVQFDPAHPPALGQLVSVHVRGEENSGAVYMSTDITFNLIGQKDESTMVKSKLHPQQKQPKAANTALTL